VLGVERWVFGVCDLGFRVSGVGLRIQGLGFRYFVGFMASGVR